MQGPQYEAGKYLGRITHQALSQAGTGNSQIVLRFLVLGRINPVDPDGEMLECPQHERTMYRTITDKTIEYVVQDLEALGYDRDSFKYLDPTTNGFFDLTGKEVQFYCSHEPRQNNQGLKEQWGLARAGAFEVKALAPKQVRDLDNLFGKQLKKLPKRTTNGPPNGNPSLPTQEELEEAAALPPDLPF